MGQTIVKANARKVRRLGKGDVIARLCRRHRRCLCSFERLEAKLEQHPGQSAARLRRAGQGLAHRPLSAPARSHDGRRRHEITLVLSGTGDVLEPEDGVAGIGSGGQLCAGRGARADRRLDSTPKRSRARRSTSPPTSASTPTTMSPSKAEIVRVSVDRLLPARNRLRTRPLHRRPGATPSAPSPSRCATAGAGSSSPTNCARKCCRKIS